jgi:hypothetical protein
MNNSQNFAAMAMMTFPKWLWRTSLVVVVGLILPCPALVAQRRPLPNNVHYFLSESGEPGAVAHAQIARGVPGVGSYQAVQVTGPEGLNVALARDGQFLPTLDAPVMVGMMVGAVYRLRVTGIPFRPGDELYPTIEVIDRLYAPAGREHRFPIPIVLEAADLRSAMEGNLVTRVIYVEDSEVASPIAARPGEQRVLDVGPMENALKTADQLGRPVAILRIGSRTPANLQGDLTDFLYGCPPWIPVTPVPTRQGLIEKGLWSDGPTVEASQELLPERHEVNEPRIPLR